MFLRAGLPILPLEAWLEGIVFSFGTIRSVIVSCAGIAAFAMAGLRAASLTLVLGVLLGVIILCCLIAITFFGGVHHVYIIGLGGGPAPCGRWFLLLFTVVHTVDVFGAEIEHVG